LFLFTRMHIVFDLNGPSASVDQFGFRCTP
jgi:hypothetical protein